MGEKDRNCDLSAMLERELNKIGFGVPWGGTLSFGGLQQALGRVPGGVPGANAFSKWPTWGPPGSPQGANQCHFEGLGGVLFL
jgi:hypothetical protein